MSEQRATYRGTAYVRRGGNANVTHEHRWQSYPADPRFEYCLYCPERRMAEWTTQTLPKATCEAPAAPLPSANAGASSPLQPGERVRILAHCRPAYPKPYCDWEGVTVSVSQNRTTHVRRWLVDFGITRQWGRQRIREEHLERVEVTP